MTITPQQLRVDFPEFSSTTVFSNSAVTFWLNVAYQFLNADRWGSTIDLGAELFAAHNLVIEAKAQASSGVGGIPGEQVGPISSKSVDKVSISYDNALAAQDGAGHWNLTVYGTRFARIQRMMGAGPLFIGVGATPVGSGLAWPGPTTIPGIVSFGS